LATQSAEWRFQVDEPSADGHFPNHPIIPGAVLLREVARVLSADDTRIFGEIRSAKFLNPVRPGDKVTITWEEKATGEIGFTCSTGAPGRRVLVGSLHMRAR
jgi:3-hydroxymyristoyl/3-hydroxydecanoyl-(acyl carrier protein) dehydratase